MKTLTINSLRKSYNKIMKNIKNIHPVLNIQKLKYLAYIKATYKFVTII